MIRLTVLHTADLHGRVEQVFRIAALARRIKQTVTAGGGHCAVRAKNWKHWAMRHRCATASR